MKKDFQVFMKLIIEAPTSTTGNVCFSCELFLSTGIQSFSKDKWHLRSVVVFCVFLGRDFNFKSSISIVEFITRRKTRMSQSWCLKNKINQWRMCSHINNCIVLSVDSHKPFLKPHFLFSTVLDYIYWTLLAILPILTRTALVKCPPGGPLLVAGYCPMSVLHLACVQFGEGGGHKLRLII